METATAFDADWIAVMSAQPASMDRPAIVDLFRSVAAVRAACDAVEVLAVRRTRELSAAGTSEPADHLVANQTGRSSKHAREVTAREEACQAMPGLEAGLSDGRMSAGHLDAAAAAHGKLKDEVAEQFAAHADQLVDRSQQVGVDAFERECRDLARHLTAINDRNAEVDELERQKAESSVKRWVDKTTGMHNTLISLDPIRDAKMWKAINNQVGRERQQRKANGETPLPFAALQAQAVVATVTSTPVSQPPAESPAATTAAPTTGLTGCHGRVASDATPASPTSATAIRLPEISILCDVRTLQTGIRAVDGICETDDGVAIPPEAVRRLACDAKVIPILLGTEGEVLDQGRHARTATPAQRIALAAMHRSCAFPGCTIRFSDCRIHHVRWWWEHNGPTDIANLLPLCENDHHRVHEGGWGLSLDADRNATWTRPDGSFHHHGPTINRPPPDIER